MSRPSDYKRHFISAVVKRSGICRATVEQVLPAVFDEIRYQLSEGAGKVPIESFGTFIVVDIPERQYHYTYGGRNEIRTCPATQRLKFAPTRNMRREVIETHKFDPSRRSFTHHYDDPPLRKKNKLGYNNKQKGFWRGPVPRPEASETPEVSETSENSEISEHSE